MILTDLPTELIQYIFLSNGEYKTKNIICNCLIYHNHDVLTYIMALRIQVAMRLSLYRRKLKNFISLGLTRIFNLPPLRNVIIRNGLPNIIFKKKNNSCIYYAPHIPNSKCRFCFKYEKDHLLPGHLIESDYCDIISR